MIGWWTLWKCLVACLFGELSQQPTCPHVRHRRRCTQLLPMARHSSHPSGVRGFTSRIWSRCLQAFDIGVLPSSMRDQKALGERPLAVDPFAFAPEPGAAGDLDRFVLGVL